MCRSQYLAECLCCRDNAGTEAGEALVFERDEIVVAHGAQRGKASPISEPLGPGSRRGCGNNDVGIAGYHGFNINRGTEVAQITEHVSRAAQGQGIAYEMRTANGVDRMIPHLEQDTWMPAAFVRMREGGEPCRDVSRGLLGNRACTGECSQPA